MKSIIALEELIKEEEKRITILKRQIADDESGIEKLTFMAKASTETSLEENNELLNKHRLMLEELMQQDIQELEKQEKIKEAIIRKNYYHFQKIRLKRDKVHSSDEKLEAMMIVDELPSEVQFEDQGIFEIAEKTIELHLRLHEGIEEQFRAIKNDFAEQLKDIKDENINELAMLNIKIPIVVLHFSVLLSNIRESIKEDKLSEFRGFPRFQDWWIKELWTSHLAYFGLYKWKLIISGLCITSDQKRAWEVIFSDWIFVKKILDGKGELAFNYNFVFDSLIRTYAELEEELDKKNLSSMKSIVKTLTLKEDFSRVAKNHNMVTSYLKYKRTKLDYKKE